MTDYNDGKWHGWNGGECPVEQEATVLFQTIGGVEKTANDDPWPAKDARWNHEGNIGDIIAFRVTKPAPPKPREWWLRLNAAGDCCGTDPVEGDPPPNWDLNRTIRVREVLPE